MKNLSAFFGVRIWGFFFIFFGSMQYGIADPPVERASALERVDALIADAIENAGSLDETLKEIETELTKKQTQLSNETEEKPGAADDLNKVNELLREVRRRRSREEGTEGQLKDSLEPSRTKNANAAGPLKSPTESHASSSPDKALRDAKAVLEDPNSSHRAKEIANALIQENTSSSPEKSQFAAQQILRENSSTGEKQNAQNYLREQMQSLSGGKQWGPNPSEAGEGNFSLTNQNTGEVTHYNVDAKPNSPTNPTQIEYSYRGEGPNNNSTLIANRDPKSGNWTVNYSDGTKGTYFDGKWNYQSPSSPSTGSTASASSGTASAGAGGGASSSGGGSTGSTAENSRSSVPIDSWVPLTVGSLITSYSSIEAARGALNSMGLNDTHEVGLVSGTFKIVPKEVTPSSTRNVNQSRSGQVLDLREASNPSEARILNNNGR